MTSANRSYLGIAKQTAKGTPNVTDAAFQYLTFNRGAMAPNTMFLPSDDGIGGGALPSEVQKVGVSSAGAVNFLVRPTMIGDYLIGAIGSAAAPVADGLGYKHVFTLPADEFDAPYFTARSAPGNLWGETFQDCRIGSLVLSWQAANYLRGTAALIGGTPSPNVVMTGWTPESYIDRGPTMVAPNVTVTWPSETVKILNGQIAFGAAIPLDEQWITGSYAPDGFDIVGRGISVTMTLKVIDASLYTKIMYDGSSGAATAWAADMYRESGLILEFDSSQEYDTGKPYKVLVNMGNDETLVADENVRWSATPINLMSGRQVTMVVTGTILASPTAAEPVSVELYNDVSTQY